MIKDYAPILLFTYKRLDTLKKTVTALQNNLFASDSRLFIFSDGAKEEKDTVAIIEVREYIRSINGFKDITIFESDRNKGLAPSIIDGVTMILETFEKVIVLEDDLITTPNFIAFMNKCLQKYQPIQNVFSISGYSFNLGHPLVGDDQAYFLNRGWSWGWGTWADRWDGVDWKVTDYKSFVKDKDGQKRFSAGGSDLNKMLSKQMNGELNSWAIRWFYHQFKVSGLTLYPISSKVYNNGFDEFATHTNGSNKRYIPLLDLNNSEEFILPDLIKINDFYQNRFIKKMSLKSRFISKLETMIKLYLK